MNHFEKIQERLFTKNDLDRYSPTKHLWPMDVMAIISYAENMHNEIQRLTKENELYRITINAENDRLDRNNQLETENEALRLKEKSYICDMQQMFQTNERLAANLAHAQTIIEAYQRQEAYFNQSVQDHICRSCANDECANSYPGDGSNLDFCEYWKQK